jgi:rhodanese-related sulfurtransferase
MYSIGRGLERFRRIMTMTGRSFFSKASLRAMSTSVLVLVFALPMWAQAQGVSDALNEMLSEAKQFVDFVTAEELAAMLEENREMKLVDVRTEAEYEAGHLQGAVWIPRGKLEFVAAGGEVVDVEDEIVIYCKQDGRASLAAATLKRLGFEKVRYVEGGFKEWVEAGYSIYNLHGELTVLEYEAEE